MSDEKKKPEADPRLSDLLREGVGSTWKSLYPGVKLKIVTQNGMDARLFEVKAVRKRDIVIKALPFFATRQPMPDESKPLQPTSGKIGASPTPADAGEAVKPESDEE